MARVRCMTKGYMMITFEPGQPKGKVTARSLMNNCWDEPGEAETCGKPLGNAVTQAKEHMWFATTDFYV